MSNAGWGAARGRERDLGAAVVVQLGHAGAADPGVGVGAPVRLPVPETSDVARREDVPVEAPLGVGLAVVPGLGLRRRCFVWLGGVALV